MPTSRSVFGSASTVVTDTVG
jgi:hypothetical protein